MSSSGLGAEYSPSETELGRVARELVAETRKQTLQAAAEWFTLAEFARSNVELGFRRRFAQELRELAERDALWQTGKDRK